MSLPRTCPRCGARAGDALKISSTMSHRIARQLQSGAGLAAPLGLLLAFLYINREGLAWERGLGTMLIGSMVAPSLVLYAVSMFFPHVRAVSCASCSWFDEVHVSRW